MAQSFTDPATVPAWRFAVRKMSFGQMKSWLRDIYKLKMDVRAKYGRGEAGVPDDISGPIEQKETILISEMQRRDHLNRENWWEMRKLLEKEYVRKSY